ncbi:MAG: methyl-accepting chemotaxis protein [Paracoccaceae bacterium]|jgi:methyl-accepting chemotaxis protein
MSIFKNSKNNLSALVEALDRSQAVIEFQMDGTIITANENFLATLGYDLDEIQGEHHSLFVEPVYKDSAEYTEFWEALNRGEYQVAEYKRIGKGGNEVWIQASYNPILNMNCKPFKVVKYATDVTEQKLRNADFEGQLSAISKAQAVIEFQMDGTIITANQNFLSTLGYDLDEIQGKHHSLFVEPGDKGTAEYVQFWEALNRGEYQAAEYKRIGKGGKEVWIQASYNPILNMNGEPFKVVKYATDITEQVQEQLRRAEIQKTIDAGLSEIAEAVSMTNEQATSIARQTASDNTCPSLPGSRYHQQTRLKLQSPRNAQQSDFSFACWIKFHTVAVSAQPAR